MVRQHPMSYNCRLLKIVHWRRESIFVTNIYLWLKYYLNFCLFVKSNIGKFKLVADEMRSSNTLANAIANFMLNNFLKKLLKIINNNYSLFSRTKFSRRSLTIFLTVVSCCFARILTSVLKFLGTSTTNLTVSSDMILPPFFF